MLDFENGEASGDKKNQTCTIRLLIVWFKCLRFQYAKLLCFIPLICWGHLLYIYCTLGKVIAYGIHRIWCRRHPDLCWQVDTQQRTPRSGCNSPGWRPATFQCQRISLVGRLRRRWRLFPSVRQPGTVRFDCIRWFEKLLDMTIVAMLY